jgi:hypothetical protein
VGNTALKPKVNENHLIMLRMELKAIRDRAMADFDAALAKVDAAIPEEEIAPRSAAMRKWTPARWREFLDTGR